MPLAVRRLALVGLLCLAPTGAAPQTAEGGGVTGCGLALALLVDVSGSVNHREYRTQMDGLADALRDGIVSEALVRQRAALTLIQWTGKSRQVVSIPWTRLEDFEAVEALAARISATPRVWRHFSTSIGEALALAETTLAEGPDCRRRVVDISGDGRSNEGRAPGPVRDRLAAAGVTVNALVITDSEAGLLPYFERKVIGGPNAFALAADSYADYPERIREKLLRETARVLTRPMPAPGTFVITTGTP